MDASYVHRSDSGPPGSDRRVTVAVERVGAARRRPDAVLLEGVHALKHAVRFGAEIEAVVTPDHAEVQRLLAELAPDVLHALEPVEVGPETWRRLAPRELPSPVLSAAVRPPDRVAGALLARRGRLVLLEQPRHLGNLGAAIRVAAAADAAGVVVVGEADPWHPTAVRASAGLGFALPVGRVDVLPETPRPLVAVDPGGRDLHASPLPGDAALLFGTERGGLSAPLRARATEAVAIPMRAGVSSINLAAAVGVTLYARP